MDLQATVTLSSIIRNTHATLFAAINKQVSAVDAAVEEYARCDTVGGHLPASHG